LPRSLDPLPGESLPGYLLRLAHRLRRSPHRLATITGLADRPAASLLGGHVIHLDRASINGFAAVTKLTPSEVERLGFADLTGRYSPLNPGYLGRRRRRDRLASTEPWIFGRWSRYCPTCLAGDGSAIQREHGGAWQRLWRLPPVFACTDHQRLLETRCPICDQPAASLHPGKTSMVGCPRVEDLHPAQCRNRVTATRTARVSTACGARLDSGRGPTTTSAVDPALLGNLLTFQHRILRLLDPALTADTSSAGQPTTADRHFTDLRLIANLICLTWPAAQSLAFSAPQAAAIDGHVDERRHAIRHADRHHTKTQQHTIYDKPPTDSLACGSLLALADHLLNPDDTGITDRRLGQLIGGKPTANWAAHFLRNRNYCSPGLRTAAEPHVAVYRPRDQTGRPPLPGSRTAITNRQRRTRAEPRPKPPSRKSPIPKPPPAQKPPPPPPKPAAARKPARAPAPRTVLPRKPVTPKPHPAPSPPALLRADGPFGYTHEHVPAFLTASWQQRYLPAPTTIAGRYLRRVAAVVLVQYAEQCTIEDAAALLCLPAEPVRTAYGQASTWARYHPDGAALPLSLQNLAAHLGHPQRRSTTVLAGERWPTGESHPDWQHTVEQLHRTSNTTQRQRSDWGERKHNTASALVWVHATQGEHLFAPHRHSPDARPGSVDDRGLSIDRAWWRAHQPGRHYALLKDLCSKLADRITAAIDQRENTGGLHPQDPILSHGRPRP
jgi:hypothetical protein